MAEGNEKNNRSCSRSHPPPPCDPFSRYQAPWPRNDNDEQNPFIQFRRFADEQLQSFFSGVPKLFGVFSSNPDSFQREIDQMMQQRHEFEEGLRKQFEQDLEEQRQAFKRLKQWHEEQCREYERDPEPPKPEAKSPWWSNGTAAKCPALNHELPERAQKCPAMFDKDGHAKTELDAYDAIQAIQPVEGNKHGSALTTNPDMKGSRGQAAPTEEQKKTTLPPGWLSGMGWDGKQREENTKPWRPSWRGIKDNDSATTVSRSSSQWLNPFDNPHDTIPWLLANRDSPIFLCNPNQLRVARVTLQQGVNQPFHIVNTTYLPRRHFVLEPGREQLAKQLPWADAFEDLVSLQQTGKMVERNYSTYRTPKTWIHDMVRRGSLGPTWGFNEQGQLTKLLQDEKVQPAVAEPQDPNPAFFRSPPLPSPEDVIAAGVISATAHASEDLNEPLKEAIDKATKVEAQADPTSPKQEPVQVSPGESQSSWSSSSTTWSSSEPSSEQSDSIISTTTRTERWTKPDGTVETRRVFKKRFADGREVEEETHDYDKPKYLTQGKRATPWQAQEKESKMDDVQLQKIADKQTQTSTPVQDALKEEKRKGGWFWN